MMKKITYIIGCLLALGFIACEQSLDTWSGEDVIYFEQTVDSTVVSFVYIDSKDTISTVNLMVRVMGTVTSDRSRWVNVKITSTNAAEGIDYVPLETSYEILPDRNYCYIPVELLRNDGLKKEMKEITLELVANDDFKLYYPEDVSISGASDTCTKTMHRIIFHEMMINPPKTWRDYQFGKFTAKKFQTICDVMEIPREQFIDPTYMTIGRCNFVAAYMKDFFQTMKEAGTPILEEDGSEMKMGDNI